MGEFDNLGDEILLEIFKRVPVKFAHRCKSVSKRCLNLISSDYFSLCYNRYYSRLANSIPRFALVYHFVKSKKLNSKRWEYYKFRMVHFYDPPFLPIDFGPSPPSPSPPLETDDIHVLGCSNGLVLCSDTSASPAQYYVCNAVNKKWVTIPQSSRGAARVRVGFLCRAPILSFNNFNKNTSNNEDCDISCSFRIVRILLDKDGWGGVKVEVYASETGEWEEIVLDKSVILKLVSQEPQPYYLPPTYNSDDKEEISHGDNGIACNGSLYWGISGVLLVIDPYNGKHGTVKLSDEIVKYSSWDRKQIYIGETNGRLRCTTFHFCTLTIYELENNDLYAGNWLSVQGIYFQKIKHDEFSWIGSFFSGCSSGRRQGFSSIVFHPFDENVLFICFPGNITLFNMETEALTTIWDVVGNEYQRDSLVPRAFPIVLPWWPLLETRVADKSETMNNFETLDLDFEKLKLESA